MKKRLMALLLATTMVSAMAGSAVVASADSAANSTESVAGAEVPESVSSDKKFAVILKTQATDFWKKMWNGVDGYAKEAGLKVDLYAAQSDTDYEAQLSILENAINSGEYAGIAIAPCSGVNMISGVKAANDAGITIVNIDEQFDPKEMESQGASCVAYVSSDNVAIGNLGASYIAGKLDKGSQVGIIEGIAGNVSSEDRKNGATAAFTDAGMDIIGSKACDWDMQTAMDTVATWIQQYPDLKAVYCCNDGMAMGAMQAIINANKVGDILLCGTDGDADAIDAVAAGNMTATVAQDSATVGVDSLKILVDAVENPDKYTAVSSPAKTPVDAILVTADNAASMTTTSAASDVESTK